MAIVFILVPVAAQTRIASTDTEFPRADLSLPARQGQASAEIVWIRQGGGEGVAVDAEGNAFVVGKRSAARISNACSTLSSTGEGGGAFLRKYSAAGDELWTRQFLTNATDGAYAVAVDFTGVYVTGLRFGAFSGFENAGQADVYVRKYDVDGHRGMDAAVRRVGL